jgi:preprotein translocase subunit SecA
MRQNSSFILATTGTATASQVTASIDTRGYNFARIMCLGLTNVGLNTTVTNNKIEHSDDNATWVVIDGASAGTAGYTPSTTTVATNLAKIVTDIDLRGKRRYLKVTFTPNSGTVCAIAADLGLPTDDKSTAAAVGSAFYAAT